MRVIVCDRCGAEITGNPVKIYFQTVDRITGEEELDCEELDCIDLCGACADRIAEGIRKSCKQPAKSANQSCDVASPPPIPNRREPDRCRQGNGIENSGMEREDDRGGDEMFRSNRLQRTEKEESP